MDHDEYLRIFGRRVKDVRESQGLTQEELAWRCNFHTTYVSLIENGHRNPSLVNLARLALGLGVSISEIIPEPSVEDDFKNNKGRNIISPQLP